MSLRSANDVPQLVGQTSAGIAAEICNCLFHVVQIRSTLETTFEESLAIGTRIVEFRPEILPA
jgi:hypothetical protein